MNNKSLLLSVVVFCLAVTDGICGFPIDASVKMYAPYPNPGRGYVTDIAGILTSQQEECLEGWLCRAETETGVEIVVVTIRSMQDYPGTANGNIESFATGLFNTCGVGAMPENNGVLLCVAIEDRKARIELGKQYGHQRDKDAENIMQNVILPCFKKGDYARGVLDGTRQLILEFAHIRIIPAWIKWVVFTAAIITLLVCISLFRNGKRGWGWAAAGLLIILVLGMHRILKKDREDFEWGWGSDGGSSDSGGSSGGGGASGSW